jgi:cytochrome c oxidase cbb3-type subunit III
MQTPEVDPVTFWLALLFLQQPLDLPNVKSNPNTSAPDIQMGKRLYAGRCAGCHGPAGNGGKGANLAAPSLSRASEDLGLYRVIRYGIPETEMPGSNMAPREIWQVAAFVRTLGQVSQGGAISGDPRRGEQLLRGKGGCLQCHRVGMEGGSMGPVLTDVGRRRGPDYLRAKLLDPEGNLPDDFRMVELTTLDGRKLRGVRMNEDTWSIQLRDTAGDLHSLWKQEVRDLALRRQTPMPSYRPVLSTGETNDVVAYLAGLRGFE